MALSKDSTMNVLPSNPNSDSIRENQKKAFEYFQSLDKVKQNELVKKFENEKIKGHFLDAQYQKN